MAVSIYWPCTILILSDPKGPLQWASTLRMKCTRQRSAQHLGDSRLDTFVSIGDDQLHPTEAAAGQLARNSVQIGSASEVPISMPST